MQPWLEFLDWLREWQFLVGSGIVLLAAALTVRAINRQIKQRHFEIEDRRNRLVQALRTSLPDDLERLRAYSRRSADAAREAVMFITNQESGREDLNLQRRGYRGKHPTLPAHVLSNLKMLIENLDADNARQFVDLVECYHIQHAQLVTAINSFKHMRMNAILFPKDLNFNPVFKQTLELYLRTKETLPFARGEAEKVVIAFGPPKVLAALKELDIDSVISPEAREHCVRFLSGEKAHGAAVILQRKLKMAS
jgi:hypothetical protein